MLFTNEELFNNKIQLDCFMSKIENYIKFTLKTLLMYKTILLNYTLKVATKSENHESTSIADQTVEFLSRCKHFIDVNNKALDDIKELKNNFENLKIPYELKDLQDYFKNYDEKITKIILSQLDLNSFLVQSSELLDYSIYKENSDKIVVNDLSKENTIQIKSISNEDKISIEKEEKNEISDNTAIVNEVKSATSNTTNNIQENISLDYPENTLIISEVSGTVLLPYYKEELNKLVNNESTDINDLIRKHYIIPIEKYKYPVLSRFKEAFKLMRNIEKRSIVEAIDLAMELSFNSNLHPAIISACRNLNELDIYLDYLDNNQTEKFNCFSIKFEILPIKMQ